MGAAAQRAVRVCLDVNIFVSDFLSGRRGNPGGPSSKIVNMVRDGACALGPLQLVLSWRMLTTLSIVLERLGEAPGAAWATSELFAAVAEFGPLQEPPTLILGGSGLLPLMDSEDIGVAETAFAGKAGLFITADLDDFEFGPKSALKTKRLMAKSNRKPQVLIMENPAGQIVVAVVPELAVAWFLGQTPLPTEVATILAPPKAGPDANPALR
jgi:predicted nucleic acid-binding protein